MCRADNKKGEKIKIGFLNQECIEKFGEKENYNYLGHTGKIWRKRKLQLPGHTGSRHHQTEMKENVGK